MKKICLLIFFICCISTAAFSQTGRWIWISGSSTVNAPAVFGTQGVPSVNNHPPALHDAIEWKDKNGNLWLYGGNYPLNTDLWKFNPTTLEWTWVKGNGTANQAISYGTKGIANSTNTPGQRSYTAPSWVDTSGALWLMGGDGQHDDMWKYDISTNMWTWMKGTSTNTFSVHGTMGTAAAANTPGNRYSTAATWTDSLNNLWLFGGFGWQDDGTAGAFTDLWKFNVATNNWTWVKGSQFINIAPVFGTKGTAAAANTPGGRFVYSKWKDKQSNLWILGGLDWVNFGLRNDLWKYNYSTGNWAWMSGPNTLNNTGTYTTQCTFSTTGVPDSRWYNRASVTDNGGGFWLFGGSGNDSLLNDLWVFDTNTLKWNLARGPYRAKTGSYGTKGVAAATNAPPARMGSVAWWGNNNKFYMYGGQLGDNATIYGDMWMFDPDTTCTPTANRALPIELLDFSAIYKENAVQVTWTTSIEINNDFFTVEKTKNGFDFTTVLTMKGAGNSKELLTYHAIDEHPYTGISYYRLKQTDYDGRYSYSDLVAVNNTEKSTDYVLFPNPASHELTIYAASLRENEPVMLILTNAFGQAIPLPSSMERRGGSTVIDIGNLPSGVYFLELRSEYGNVVKRFVKE